MSYWDAALIGALVAFVTTTISVWIGGLLRYQAIVSIIFIVFFTLFGAMFVPAGMFLTNLLIN